MADIFYVPPKQKRVECQYLEKNYISCIIQKAMKDRIGSPVCDLHGVIFFHVECPDWVKRFDAPDAKDYIKRQLFSMLMLPYIHTKMNSTHYNFLNWNIVEDKFGQFKNIKYPEEIETSFNYEKTDSTNMELFKKHKEFYSYNTNFGMNFNAQMSTKLPGKLAEAEE